MKKKIIYGLIAIVIIILAVASVRVIMNGEQTSPAKQTTLLPKETKKSSSVVVTQKLPAEDLQITGVNKNGDGSIQNIIAKAADGMTSSLDGASLRGADWRKVKAGDTVTVSGEKTSVGLKLTLIKIK